MPGGGHLKAVQVVLQVLQARLQIANMARHGGIKGRDHGVVILLQAVKCGVRLGGSLFAGRGEAGCVLGLAFYAI